MAIIKTLPEHIISKIAAGEVIEKPVYAVKELVENALDAHATSIIVQTQEGGLKNITVIDDGDGMNNEDAMECYKPHTTSKIFSEESLHQVATLGFRGEALSSIAAISQMIIKTKPENAVSGTIIEINEGKLVSASPIGIPQGTSISINNLFSNLPARKKFIKNNSTESRQITELVMQYAVAYPKIHFHLSHNQKVIFDLPNSSNVADRIKILLGSTIFENLLPINYQDSYIQITGFLVKPQVNFSTIQKQLIFVNNRKINDKMISLAVKEAYGNLLDTQSYPAFILFINLPYETVDVNIHPRKEHLSFLNSRFVFDSIYKSAQETLTKYNLTFSNLNWKDNLKSTTKTYTGKILKEQVMPWDIRQDEVLNNTPIIQLQNLYLVTPTKTGFFIIDQHAAHERILYEQYLQEFLKQKKQLKILELTEPITMELNLLEGTVLQENIPLFKQFGFEIEYFKGQTYVIYSIPEIFQDRRVKDLILELLEDLSEKKVMKQIDNLSHQIIEYLACRTAIKAGDNLNQEQTKRLIDKLEQTPNNYTCPHGRPTKISFTLNQLNHLFKRS